MYLWFLVLWKRASDPLGWAVSRHVSAGTGTRSSEGQPVLLTTNPSLQPLYTYTVFFRFPTKLFLAGVANTMHLKIAKTAGQQLQSHVGHGSVAMCGLAFDSPAVLLSHASTLKVTMLCLNFKVTSVSEVGSMDRRGMRELQTARIGS